MGRSVSTIRDRFYRDLILEYTNKGEQSFLYRYFWFFHGGESAAKGRI